MKRRVFLLSRPIRSLSVEIGAYYVHRLNSKNRLPWKVYMPNGEKVAEFLTRAEAIAWVEAKLGITGGMANVVGT